MIWHFLASQTNDSTTAANVKETADSFYYFTRIKTLVKGNKVEIYLTKQYEYM